MPYRIWQFTDAVEIADYAYYAGLIAAAAATIDFSTGGRQSIDATTYPNILLTPAVAGKPAHYVIDILNSTNLVSIAPTAGGNIEWEDGNPPSWNGTTILFLYYNGITWRGSSIVNAS